MSARRPRLVLRFSLAGAGSWRYRLDGREAGRRAWDGPRSGLRMDLSLDQVTGGEPLAPYVSLIHDVTIADRSLFTTSTGLSHAWNAATEILDSRPQPYPLRFPDRWVRKRVLRCRGRVDGYWTPARRTDGGRKRSRESGNSDSYR